MTWQVNEVWRTPESHPKGLKPRGAGDSDGDPLKVCHFLTLFTSLSGYCIHC